MVVGKYRTKGDNPFLIYFFISLLFFTIIVYFNNIYFYFNLFFISAVLVQFFLNVLIYQKNQALLQKRQHSCRPTLLKIK